MDQSQLPLICYRQSFANNRSEKLLNGTKKNQQLAMQSSECVQLVEAKK